MIEETLFEAEEKMERAIDFAKDARRHPHRPRDPGMFARIVIDYYGVPHAALNMASIAILEPRMVIIKPHDPTQIKAMEKAIRDLDPQGQPEQRGHPDPSEHPPDDGESGAAT